MAQNYFGIGVHVAPHVSLDNRSNSFVDAKGILTPAYSISFKKNWKNKKNGTWYLEGGFEKIGLGYNLRTYSNDTVNIWNEYNLRHVGFPTIFVGGGKMIPVGKAKRKEFSFGLEGSYRIAHDLGGIFSALYGIDLSLDDITFPFFFRMNIGYNIPLKLFNQIPAHIQFYTKASFQDIARGPQYIVDPTTGIKNENGKYSLNNSVLGVKLYTDLGKEYYKFNRKKTEKKRKRTKNGKPNFRLSVEGQLYSPPATQYYIPQFIDSFSLEGVRFSLTNQIGIKSEFIHYKNENWSTIIGLGVGKTTSTTHFTAQPEFTRDGLPIDTPNGGFVGFHLIPNVGVAYKHRMGKKYLQHSFSTTFAVPITNENESVIVVERSFLTQPIHLSPKILEGDIDSEYGRDKILIGVEYQPELLFNSGKRFFYGFGLVFNYSHGVIAQGRVRVNNDRSQYYGGLLQGFSKIGITARIGWNSNKQY